MTQLKDLYPGPTPIAADITIVDSGDKITATDVEGALQENRTAIDLNTAKETNVATNLSEGTATVTAVDVNSSDGTNATLVSASTSRAGLLTKAKFDEIVANTAKESSTAANVASIIVAADAKTTPIAADTIALIDSADSDSLKEVTITQLSAALFAIAELSNKYAISDDLLHSHDAEYWGTAASYTKKKTITLDTLSLSPSTIRVKFDLKAESGTTGYGRVYKNGVAIGTEQSTTSTSYVTFSEDLSFEMGDTLELWVKDGTAGSTFVGCVNFRVYGTTAVLTLKEAVENSDMGETVPFVGTNS